MKTRLLIIIGIIFSGGFVITNAYGMCFESDGVPAPCFDSHKGSSEKITEKWIMNDIYSYIQRNYDSWEMSDMSFANIDEGYDLPDIICTEFVVDGVKQYRMAEWIDEHTISDWENHYDPSLCFKWFAPISNSIPVPEPVYEDIPIYEDCGPGTILQDDICMVTSESIPDKTKGKWEASYQTLPELHYPPPLKQLNAGVAIQDIQCNEGKFLIHKRVTLSPACVSDKASNDLIFPPYSWAKLRIGMPAEDITQERLCVWIPENPLIQRHCDWGTNILFTFKDEGLVPASDEILRLYAMEKRQLFRDFQSDAQEKYGSEHMWELLPAHYIGYDYHREALEFGIHHEVFDEKSAPKYVEFIRSIVGEKVNLTVRPAYPIVPQSFPTGESFDD